MTSVDRVVAVSLAAALLASTALTASAGVAVGFGGVEFEGDETAVFNENSEELPPGCEEVSGDADVTVSAASAGYGYPLFEYHPPSVEVDACERVTVTFESQTRVRHQWIVRGLPEDTYPDGYFGVEVDGATEESATFITPGEQVTLPVESSVGSQSESGLRGQVKVDGGDGDVDGIPGLTQHGWREADDGDGLPGSFYSGALGFLVGVALVAGGRWFDLI